MWVARSSMGRDCSGAGRRLGVEFERRTAMAIQKIKGSNFKSFDELEVELRPLNIVIGANAAGKSNFLEAFRFLRDVAKHGIENAVSLQGGVEYLTNLRIRGSRPV